MSNGAIFLKPVNRLKGLALRGDGVSRQQAVKNAEKRLSEIRDRSVSGIVEALDGIEAVCAQAGPAGLDDAQLKQIVSWAERISAVAHAYEFPRLERVAGSLGAMAVAMTGAGKRPREPFLVHVQTARWVIEFPERDAGPMMAGLEQVVQKYT